LLLFADFVDLSRKSRVFKDRVNPFEDYDDEEFKKRFRLSKLIVNRVHEQVKS